MNLYLSYLATTVVATKVLTYTTVFRITLFRDCIDAATRDVLYKKAFFKILQNLQENTCTRVSFLTNLQASGMQLYEKRGSGTGVFL